MRDETKEIKRCWVERCTYCTYKCIYPFIYNLWITTLKGECICYLSFDLVINIGPKSTSVTRVSLWFVVCQWFSWNRMTTRLAFHFSTPCSILSTARRSFSTREHIPSPRLSPAHSPLYLVIHIQPPCQTLFPSCPLATPPPPRPDMRWRGEGEESEGEEWQNRQVVHSRPNVLYQEKNKSIRKSFNDL